MTERTMVPKNAMSIPTVLDNTRISCSHSF